MANKTYFDERNIQNTQKLRELRKDLPFICNEYFIGTESQTSVLTRLQYAYDLKTFFYFLTTEIYEFVNIKVKYIDYVLLNKISTTHIEMFFDYLSYYKIKDKEYSNSLKTKARKLATIRSFFKYNYNKGNLEKDVASKVLTPKLNDKAIIRLEQNEVVDLLDTIEFGTNEFSPRQMAFCKRSQKRDLAICSLFLSTGIRISELVGIDINDIDFSQNAFKITRKGGNESILYFTDEVADVLSNYLDERAKNNLLDGIDAMFLSAQNKRITVRSVENLVKKFAGVVTPLKNITPHKLRSTFGTNLYRQTNDIYVVAEVLGHKDINTTKKHYAQISEDIKRSASQKISLREKIDT